MKISDFEFKTSKLTAINETNKTHSIETCSQETYNFCHSAIG